MAHVAAAWRGAGAGRLAAAAHAPAGAGPGPARPNPTAALRGRRPRALSSYGAPRRLGPRALRRLAGAAGRRCAPACVGRSCSAGDPRSAGSSPDAVDASRRGRPGRLSRALGVGAWPPHRLYRRRAVGRDSQSPTRDKGPHADSARRRRSRPVAPAQAGPGRRRLRRRPRRRTARRPISSATPSPMTPSSSISACPRSTGCRCWSAGGATAR